MNTNIWGENVLDSKDSNDSNSVLYKGGVLKEFTQENDFSGLAEASEKLASNSLVMDFYSYFEKGTYGFFFSPNPNLNSATKRPSKLDNWENWDLFAANQKRTLAVLGGFKEDATDIIRNDTDLNKLKKALNKWPSTLFSVFWQNETFKGVWTCNIFVGDSIYLWKKKSFTNTKRHYYGPAEIKTGKGPFQKLDIDKVKRGAIVVFGSTHTEIITEIKTYLIADNGFCSLGAGRGNRRDTGTLRCDSSLTSSEIREIEYPKNTYYTL
ncbi:hypothetical protein [Flavobacterium sp.]|uniref:hypothetical protein n=1 Tax=Flavobacterium sp. TaxID=239 RepID=UPI00262689D5|nr:hypothetical protein [Flavobacterium sp.]MDD3005445.1 hypothetical protein [Flavobacterium sp.]